MSESINQENKTTVPPRAFNVSFRNGPILIVLACSIGLLLSWAGGALGIPLGVIILLVVLVVILPTLYTCSLRTIDSLIYAASEVIFAPYGVSDREAAFLFLKEYLLYGRVPLLIVTEGKLDQRSIDSPLVKLGMRGPGNLLVDGVSAVLIERQGTYRILMGGSQFLDQFDSIIGFLDVRVQRVEYELANVFTKDNIPLKITVATQYRIAQDQASLSRRGRPVPNVQSVIRALAAADWKLQMETTIKGKIRDLIAEYYLDDIHGTYPRLTGIQAETPIARSEGRRAESPRVPLQEHLGDALNEAVLGWGAEIVLVTVDEIEMPEEVKKALRDAWAARWNNVIKIEDAETKTKVEIIKAEGERNTAEIRKEADLISAQTKAESLRITKMADADSRVEIARRLENVRQSTGRSLDDPLLGEIFRAVGISVPESRHSKEDTAEAGNEGSQSS